MGFNPEIFRAYDIRGIYGKDFDDDFAFYLGLTLVRYLQRKRFLVAHDNRVFSAGLADNFVKGITNAGGDAEFLGLSTTPLFNFAFKRLDVDGGAIITASHNTAEYGGFKIFGEAGRIISLATGLEQIKNMLQERLESSKYGGRVNSLDKSKILDEYVKFILRRAKIKNRPAVKIKIESPAIAQEEMGRLLEKLGISDSPADYAVKFAFDGDEDRISVFDRNNEPIHSDYITAVLVQDMLRFWSKPKVVYDLRFSRGVLEKFEEWGIKHFRSRIGRAFLKDNMVKHRADISGELAGHIFFKEAGCNEMPLLTMLRILKIMDQAGKSINELVGPFKTWENSGEINITFNADLPAGEAGHLASREMPEKLKEKYGDGKIDELDGVTIEYPDWWFNLRPSNTEPVLRLVVEAKTKSLLNEKVGEIMKIVKA